MPTKRNRSPGNGDETTSPDIGSRSLRALAVLEMVAASERPITMTELTAASGLPRATMHRLCGLLEAGGYLRRTAVARGLSAGHRLLAFGHALMANSAQNQYRHAILTALARRIGETCNFNVPDGLSMLYIDRVESEWPLRLQLPVGTRVPLYCTASGKLYLSSLPAGQRRALFRDVELKRRTPNTITDIAALDAALKAIRRAELGTDDQEFLDGMVAVAVPVKDNKGRLFATLATHVPTLRMSLEALKVHVPALRDAARKLADVADG